MVFDVKKKILKENKMSIFFQNIKYLNCYNDVDVVFSCDDVYFHDYGIFNLKSCINSSLYPHCHIINPSTKTLDVIEEYKDKASFSIENLSIDKLNPYLLKTYYYCARFFIAKDLFEKSYSIKLWITDADIIFNKKPFMNNNVKLGISYNKEYLDLWKQTQASLIYITKDKKKFLDQVIDEYLKKITVINFNSIETIVDKYEKGNLIGLDQVCMSIVLSRYYLEDKNFINLHDMPNLKSKNNNSDVTILVGKNKKNKIKQLLEVGV
jgi:hypothetical protein